jgi:hypothetical protein
MTHEIALRPTTELTVTTDTAIANMTLQTAMKGHDILREALSPLLDKMHAWVMGGTPFHFGTALTQQCAQNPDEMLQGMLGFMMRHIYVEDFGWSVPTPDFPKTMAPFGSFLELGAGTGFLSQLLRSNNIPAIATDIHPQEGPYPVEKLDAQSAVATYPGHTLLVSWPGLDTDWLNSIAENMEEGQVLVLIGEGCGGCTGNEDLWDVLNTNFKDISPENENPVWSYKGIHDFLSIWRKTA